MPRKSDARNKMIRSAAELFQRQGYHGTGMAEILERSGAPKGSIYHHFPEGKEQIALEAVAYAGAGIRLMVQNCFSGAGTFDEAIACLAQALASWFDSTVHGTGCPIAAVLLDTSEESTALRDACDAAFAGWSETVEQAALSWGYGRGSAERMARAVLINMEGAWLIARAQGSSASFAEAAAISSAFARTFTMKAAPRSGEIGDVRTT